MMRTDHASRSVLSSACTPPAIAEALTDRKVVRQIPSTPVRQPGLLPMPVRGSISRNSPMYGSGTRRPVRRGHVLSATSASVHSPSDSAVPPGRPTCASSPTPLTEPHLEATAAQCLHRETPEACTPAPVPKCEMLVPILIRAVLCSMSPARRPLHRPLDLRGHGSERRRSASAPAARRQRLGRRARHDVHPEPARSILSSCLTPFMAYLASSSFRHSDDATAAAPRQEGGRSGDVKPGGSQYDLGSGGSPCGSTTTSQLSSWARSTNRYAVAVTLCSLNVGVTTSR